VTFNKAAKPTLKLLVKLGSLVVHYQEAFGPGKHLFDLRTIESLEADEEVVSWFAAMNASAMLPVKREVPSAAIARVPGHDFVGAIPGNRCGKCGEPHA
jgi:hypothetical protein